MQPIPKNICGVTKAAAEDLCELFHQDHGLACLILRTSRFFLEEDDHKAMRQAYADDNVKSNEYLFRRADIEDVVDARLRAVERAPQVGFGRCIISATTPILPDDVGDLRVNVPLALRRRVPEYARRG
jgi:nucleoside-diphosphate-sugar epimerase